MTCRLFIEKWQQTEQETKEARLIRPLPDSNWLCINDEQMKFSVFNFLCLTTIVCLAIALVVQRNADRHIILNSDNDEISWDFRNSNVVDKPTWKNKSVSPPVSLSRAFSISRGIVEKLSAKSGADWHISSINFVPLDLFVSNDSQSWCFFVNFEGYPPIGHPSTFSAVILWTSRF